MYPSNPIKFTFTAELPLFYPRYLADDFPAEPVIQVTSPPTAIKGVEEHAGYPLIASAQTHECDFASVSDVIPEQVTERAEDDDSGTETDESSDHTWSDSDESDNEHVDPSHATDRESRRRERERILAVAGLILKEDAKPPSRQSRPAPAKPRRRAPKPPKALPPVPLEDVSELAAVDDAFGRYEAYKQAQSTTNRLSIASFDTASNSQTFSSPATPSQSIQETRSYSHLLNFLGRRSTALDEKDKDRRLVISGPILQTPDSIGRENSPAFGSSWTTLIDRSVLEDIPKNERRRQEVTFPKRK